MHQYLDLVRNVMQDGDDKSDRTGTGTRSLFGPQVWFDLAAGFPLVTVKKTFWKGVVHELLWFLKGSTNIEYLVKNDVHIWDEWADENGELGPVYGKQWRSWCDYDDQGVDQIAEVISQIKRNPDSRRLIVSAWNVADLPEMALPPCHMMFQFNVTDGKLSCLLYQRSADIFLGVPFNIASYALLTHMIAHVTGLEVGALGINFGDAHIYANHFDQVREMMTREPLPLPKLKLARQVGTIDDFEFDDIILEGYTSHPVIKAKVAV